MGSVLLLCSLLSLKFVRIPKTFSFSMQNKMEQGTETETETGRTESATTKRKKGNSKIINYSQISLSIHKNTSQSGLYGIS